MAFFMMTLFYNQSFRMQLFMYVCFMCCMEFDFCNYCRLQPDVVIM